MQEKSLQFFLFSGFGDKKSDGHGNQSGNRKENKQRGISFAGKNAVDRGGFPEAEDDSGNIAEQGDENKCGEIQNRNGKSGHFRRIQVLGDDAVKRKESGGESQKQETGDQNPDRQMPVESSHSG